MSLSTVKNPSLLLRLSLLIFLTECLALFSNNKFLIINIICLMKPK